MTKVLIAVDGSNESSDAARFAHSLVGDRAEYLVVTVAESSATLAGVVPIADPTLTGAYVPAEVAQDSLDAALTKAAQLASRVAEEVDPASTFVEIGDPAETICRIAEDQHVDLIVVGSHDRSWFSRLVTPSVRNHLVEHAPCPVMVVR